MISIQGIGKPLQTSKIGVGSSYPQERGKKESHGFLCHASLLGDIERKKWPSIPKLSNNFDHACLQNQRGDRVMVLSGGKSVV
jgi:hypothetical protein